MPRQCADVFRSWSSIRYLNCPKNASSVSRKIAGSAPTLYASSATCVAKSMDWVPAWMTIASSGFACRLSRMMLRAMFGMLSPAGYRAQRLYKLRTAAARTLMPPTAIPPGGGMRRPVAVLSAFLVALVLVAISMTNVGAARSPLSTPVVMAFPAGDDWEPSVDSDGAGNVYYLATHFGGTPSCAACADPTINTQVSHDGGRTFDAPRALTVSASTQYDPQVKINAAGTVFVSYLLGKDTVVQRSDDLGASWSAPLAVNADVKQGPTDKDGLAVQGDNVYVGFDVAQKFFVSASHDGGRTFTTRQINQNTLGWPLNGGAAVAPDGTVYMVWELIHKSGQAQGPQDVLVTKSTDGGATWSLSYADRGLPPGPACPTSCGWDFLGTGAASAGEVRVAWMDNHTRAYNVWYRSSADGGSTWSAETQVSAFRSGYAYVTRQGFAFPYGDYVTLALDPSGNVQLAWGAGQDYYEPGNTLYSHS